ncbi:MAG: nucleotidyltransferase domain-containing protein [Candidatus Aenigmarchaeota archaeon]|nr:nucleotidyltransferase domain-containing protein [Candidatus Aenigmarchaeota archaeon]
MLLENVMSSKTGVRLLRIFHQFPGRIFSLSDITKITGQSTGAVYPALKKLVDSGIVKASKIGKSTAYRLNMENPLAKKTMEIFSAEREMLRGIAQEFANNVDKKNIVSIVLFGSVARGEPKGTSDIDLLVVFSKNRDVVESNVNKLAEKYLDLDIHLAPVFYSEREIIDMATHYNNFIINVEKEGIVLYGKSIRGIHGKTTE